MDLRSLQIFASVHRTLNFSQTATELHLSTSAVSRTIARMEDELGAPLFDRDRRGMRPTAAAAELLRVATRMEAEWRSLQGRLGSSDALAGELRIFCSVTATHRLLSPILAAYRDACPGVDILLITGDQADGVEHVRKGEADVAVVARPAKLSGNLSYLHVTDAPLTVCVPLADCPIRDRIDSAGPAQREEALGALPWILPERGVSREAIERWLQQRYGEIPPVYARVAGHEAIVAMVALGLGVGMVPDLVIGASGVADQLAHWMPDDAPSMAVGLCARTGRIEDPVVAALWRVAQGRDADERSVTIAQNLTSA